MPTPRSIYEETLKRSGQEAADLAYAKALEPTAKVFAQYNPPPATVPVPAIPGAVAPDTLEDQQKKLEASEIIPGYKAPVTPVSSSEGIREENQGNKSQAQNVAGQANDLQTIAEKQLQSILAMSTPDQTEAGKKAAANLANVQAKYGILSAEETKRIEDAGIAAGADIDILIREAQDQKRQGFAKAAIGAGERGGFMSTQFAGEAAIGATEGANYAGRGGELEHIQSVYDANISNLRVRRQQAIVTAQEAARTAIRTGKKDDLELAKAAVEEARKAHNDALSLAKEKLDAIQGYQKGERETQKFNREEEEQRAETGARGLLGQTLTDEQLAAKAKELNVSPQALKAQIEKITKDDAFFKGSDILSLIKETPKGEIRTITDPNTGRVFTITGTDSTTNVITITDDKGTVRGVDKNTGKVLWSAIGVGGTKSTPVTIIQNQQQTDALSDAAARINTSIGNDGYVNTEIFQKERDQFILKTGKPDLFDATFKNRLNPNDPNARRFLTKAETEQATGGAITPQQEESLRSLGISQSLIDGAKAAGLSMADLLGQ